MDWAFSGRRSGADKVVNVATVEFRFRAIALIEKFVLDVAYEKIDRLILLHWLFTFNFV